MSISIAYISVRTYPAIFAKCGRNEKTSDPFEAKLFGAEAAFATAICESAWQAAAFATTSLQQRRLWERQLWRSVKAAAFAAAMAATVKHSKERQVCNGRRPPAQ